jgi:hypothetical protein
MLHGTSHPEGLLLDRWKANHPVTIRTYREHARRDEAHMAKLSAAKLSAAKQRTRQQLRKLTLQISRDIATRRTNKFGGESCTLTENQQWESDAKLPRRLEGNLIWAWTNPASVRRKEVGRTDKVYFVYHEGIL